MVPGGGFLGTNVGEKEKVLRKRPGLHSKPLGGALLPFAVTKPVTIREVSIAVESRDASLVFGKFLEMEGCSLQSVSLDGR